MKALVTGGGGFLGSAIVRALLARGDRVRVFSRGAYPGLEALGAEIRRGDLADAAAVADACRDMDVVFHAAAKAGYWGPYEDFLAANVVGTRHVIAGCRAAGVRRLVHTSSPSVVFDGRDMEGVDESVPYPARYHSPYPETKALAEREALAADGKDLAVVVLRPHLLWGPGDPHVTSRVIDRGRRGLLKRIGDRPNRVDSTYVDNAADAHLLAADRLEPGSSVAGKVYFISNGEPRPLWDLIDRILEAAGVAPVRGRISTRAAYAAGAVLEAAWRALSLPGEPRMTRFLARELSTAHWFDLSAARRDLGYAPKVSLDEGFRRLAESFRVRPA